MQARQWATMEATNLFTFDHLAGGFLEPRQYRSFW
jgi:hypothetical protein